MKLATTMITITAATKAGITVGQEQRPIGHSGMGKVMVKPKLH
jgi:hypothetical protein